MKLPEIKFLTPVYLRGLLMGTADLIPGVSGGTMALITGIYERLLSALSSLNLNALRMLLRGRINQFWKYIDGNFLLSLFAGILTAVFLLSRLIYFLLENYPLEVWAFFFGLIAASAVYIIRQTPWRKPSTWFFVLAGALAAWLITGMLPEQGPRTSPYLFLSGAAASVAMILPGISGSYILVLMGSYAYVLESVRNFRLMNLMIFTLGVVTGLLGFSALLKWFFSRYRHYTLALMGGFLLGSLRQVWPWKKVLMTRIIEGKEIIVKARPVLPWHYEGDPHYASALLLMAAGMGLVMVFEKIQKRYG